MTTAFNPADVAAILRMTEGPYQLANQPFKLDITRRVAFINWDGTRETALVRNFAIVGA